MYIISFLFFVSPFYFYFFIFYGLTSHPPPATRLPVTRHPRKSPAELMTLLMRFPDIFIYEINTLINEIGQHQKGVFIG